MPKVNREYEKLQRAAYVKDHRGYREMVTGLMAQHHPADRWMTTNAKHNLCQPAVHHIMGRGANVEHHWFCNLILVSSPAHNYGHDQCPPALELASLYAKMIMEQLRIAAQEPLAEESKRHWHPEIMARNIGFVSLGGRIETLVAKPSIVGTPFETYGRQILAFLSR